MDDDHPLVAVLTIVMVIAVVVYELVTVTIEWIVGEAKRLWRQRN